MADPVIEKLDALEKAAENAGDESIINAVKNLRTEYDKATDPKQKEAVAKAIPEITKGVLSAVTAFKEGDAIGGSAAIMDILSGVSSALGPEGALVGALFSMISMILSFFEPKQPSLLDQIKEFMIDLEGVKEKDQLQAISNIVGVFVKDGDKYISVPPTYSDRRHNGINHPGPLTDAVDKLNVLSGPVAQTIWYAQQWLTETEYEDAEAWPAVLNLHCVVYARLRTAITRQYLYACNQDRKKKYIGRPNDDWQTRENDWNKLQSKLIDAFNIMAGSDSYTSEFLTQVVPLAHKRGLHVYHWDDSDMAVASGTKADKVREHCHRMAITPPRQGVTDPAAEYDVWVMDSVYHTLSHNTLNLKTRKLRSQSTDIGDRNNDGNALKYLDWWPVPKPGAGNKFSIYFAYDTSNWKDSGGLLQSFEWDKDSNTFTKQSWQPGAAEMMTQVRVATLAAPFPDDPDKDAMTQNDIGTQIIYATLLNSRNIFVWSNGPHYVPIPMSSYNGIAVDRNFLWVYGRDAFACATHASVMSCINKNRDIPLWLGNGNKHGRNLGPVIDLSSCEDGTLLVATDAKLCTSTYHVEFNKPGEGDPQWWLIIDEEWRTVQDGGVRQCQKLPIFGWPRVEALTALLKQPKTTLSNLPRR